MESGEIVLSGSATHAQLIDSMMDSETVPSGTRTPLQYIRYDKYTANEHVTPHAFTPVSGYAEDYHRKTVGRVTATKTRVLGTDQWITSTVYYDSKCRPMQEITDNLVGGVSRVTHSYDFVGNVVKSQEAHGANTLEYAYTYDDRSRLLNVTASFNGATPVTMKTLEYDEVGRLKKVKLHNNTTSSEYDYNIRSWLTGITGSKFSQSLTYGNGNGNIRSMNWSANGSNHSYSFTYDGANRMLNATHGTGAYTEKVTSYDKNGNILGLQRYGGSLIDNLTYSYNGNQLTQVEDATGNSAGFNNGASIENEYTYDYNGNLTQDSNKGICNIAWNSLNLPNVVTFEDGSTVTYLYAADGTKLRTLHNINGATTQKDYCGSVIYENGAAKLWQTEAGYISMNDSKYHYYLQDHQGNNRVVVNETGATEEVNHYYAFGGLFSSDESVQPFKYNGKEFDTQKGLNWYDYEARQYDAALGRWFAVDPLAEDYYNWSPYNYCLNNPIKYIDPDGKDAIITLQGNTITITSNIILTGSLATNTLAEAYLNNIMDNWGKMNTYVYDEVIYQIVWNINVRVAEEGESMNFNGINNYLEVTDKGSWVEDSRHGKIRGEGWYGMSFDETNPMSHEFGHIMGIADRYTDQQPMKGWEGNIMAESAGKGIVETRNLDVFLPKAIDYLNFANKCSSNAPWIKYSINDNNREKKREK